MFQGWVPHTCTAELTSQVLVKRERQSNVKGAESDWYKIALEQSALDDIIMDDVALVEQCTPKVRNGR